MVAATHHVVGRPSHQWNAALYLGHLHNTITDLEMGMQFNALGHIRACSDQSVVLACVILQHHERRTGFGIGTRGAGVWIDSHDTTSKGWYGQNSSSANCRDK